jgi:hypothetical protein
MARRPKIVNLDTGICMDYPTAIWAIEDACSVHWDEEGVSVRNNSDEQARQARIEYRDRVIPERGAMTCCKCHAAKVKTGKNGFCTVCQARASLAYAELNNLEVIGIKTDYSLIRAAHQFAESVA